MLFRKSQPRRPSHIVSTRHHRERLGTARALAIPRSHTRIAQAFYCDVLHGRQVWDAERADRLAFIVQGTRVDVSADASSETEPVVLSVANPDALAERCWDAGYSVRIGHESADGSAISVIDPFGRRIELVR